MRRLQGLDSIRFIAALIVVLGHFGGPPLFENLDESFIGYKILHGLYACLFNGPAAVIVFFIVSGLVIHYPYHKGKTFRLWEFYRQRYVRICVPMIVVALIALIADRLEDIGIFWSLYAELIYYTLYPLIIFLKNRIGIKTLIATTYFAGLVLIFTLPYKDTNAYVDLGNYYTWIIGLPCWLLGVYLAENVNAEYKGTFGKLVLWRLGIYGLSVILRGVKFHTEFSNLITLNLFAFIVCIWLIEEVKYYRNKPAVKTLEWAGSWSYSLYICHLLAATFIQIFLPLEKSVLQWFMLFFGTLSISYIFFLLVEKPSHYLAKKVKFVQPVLAENSTDEADHAEETPLKPDVLGG